MRFRVIEERRGQQQSLQQGLEQGLERGRPERREEIRGMQARMVHARFGGKLSERVAASLRPVRSLGLLGQVGDIVVAAETGEESLANLADLAVSKSADCNFRVWTDNRAMPGGTALEGMSRAASVRMRWKSATSDRGPGFCRVGAVRERNGPVLPRPSRTVTP